MFRDADIKADMIHWRWRQYWPSASWPLAKTCPEYSCDEPGTAAAWETPGWKNLLANQPNFPVHTQK